MGVSKAHKRALDLVLSGERLLNHVERLDGPGKMQWFALALAAWNRRFHELINDDDLQMSDGKALKGVPKAISQKLWQIESQLSLFADARCGLAKKPA